MPIDFTNVMKDKTAYLSMTEIQTMLDFCLEEERLRDYMLILTLARTGRRVSEVVGKRPYTRNVGLRPKDIHHDQRLIEFDVLKKRHIKSKGKGGQPKKPEAIKRARLKKMPVRKLFPVDDFYYRILLKYIKKKGIKKHWRIFPITRQRVDAIIKDVAKKTDIARANMKIHAHMFRHALAVNLLQNNPTDPSMLPKVQQLLDHASLNVTAAYTQFTQEDKREKLNELFN